MRRPQIGVMGSASDMGYGRNLERLAERVGSLLAEEDCILIFGAEKDCDSLSTAACRGAKRKGGLVVGVTYNKGKDVYSKEADVVIATGLDRGGGRELVLALSCDAIISIGGGSGTLTEIAIAYQGNIPIVALENSGGWSSRLANEYVDGRRRRKVYGAKTPEEAVSIATRLASEKSV